ncbi:MAG: hypothetical protein QME05_05315 [Candidatus Margulisbacteria bacterium]|nr:hypothetical protein [Candidatus Margulisiibacteriota bacterium]
MVKKLSWLLVFVLVLSVSCFAVRRGVVKAEEPKDEVVGQALVKVGSNVNVPVGETVQSAVAVGGSVVVNGKVVEDVVAVGGSVTLKEGAEVGGNVVSIGGAVVKEGGAINKAKTVEVNMPALIPVIGFLSMGNFMAAAIILSILTTLGFIVLAALLVALFTPQVGKTSAKIEKKFWQTFWWGIFSPILVTLLLIALVLSLVGILLIPIVLLVFIAACVFGYVAAAQLCGKKLMQALRLRGKPMLAEVVVGLILLWIINMIPVIGGVVNAVIGICGLGAVAVTKFGTAQ